MPASIQDVKSKYQGDLMAKPGVVSVGIGRGTDGKPVIVIGLDRERPETRKALPTQLEGYAVRVEVVGTIKAR